MRLPIRLAAGLQSFLSAVPGPTALEEEASRQDVLAPAARETLRPAIYLPGQIDRVTGTRTHYTVESAVRAAVATTITHPATIAYHFKRAILLDGVIHVGRHRHRLSESRLPGCSGEERHLTAAALASSAMGSKYFGHWLRDDCAQYFLAEAAGTCLCTRRPEFRHAGDYEAAFGQDWTPIDRARIDHLVIFNDYAQNGLKRARYEVLRARLRARYRAREGLRWVYLRRGPSGEPREIENEREIAEALTRLGFATVDVHEAGMQEIVEALMGAEAVVSMEGSHVAHCAFACPETCALLVLQPADRFSPNHRGWTQCLGMRFGFVVGRRGERGYRFSALEIGQTLDRMLKVAV